jgi:hypothetical protein
MNQFAGSENRKSQIANLKSPDGPMISPPSENPLPRVSIMTISSSGNKIASSYRVAG